MTVGGGAQWVVYGLWFVLEVAIAATDLAEVIGSGTAIYLLSNGVVPLWAGVLITALDVLLILMMGTRNFRSLELLVATFIALIAGIFACAAARLSLLRAWLSRPESLHDRRVYAASCMCARRRAMLACCAGRLHSLKCTCT